MIGIKLSFLMPFKFLVIFSSFILSASGLLCGAETSSENEERIRAYFKRFPASDANNDGVLTYSELMTHLKELRKARSQNKDADNDNGKDDEFKKEVDIRYSDKHQRNVLDYYPATVSEGPAPVYVWFHGGGFSGGDKKSVRKNGGKMIRAYLENGYAVVSCNYPFIDRENDVLRNGMLNEYVENNYISKDEPEHQSSRNEYLRIMRHCGRAIQFIRSNAKEWNIDPDKICVGGASAGALISQWLAYSDDLAVADSKDPVSRLSSKAQVAIGHVQPLGTDSLVMKYMDKGEAPLFIYSNAPKKDKIHHPINALMIRDRANELKIPCVAVGGGRNELPVPEGEGSWLSMQIEFCRNHLKINPPKVD